MNSLFIALVLIAQACPTNCPCHIEQPDNAVRQASPHSPECPAYAKFLTNGGHGVIVLGASWCGPCHAEQRALDEAGIPYLAIDKDQYPETFRVLSSDPQTIPQVIIGYGTSRDTLRLHGMVPVGRIRAELNRDAMEQMPECRSGPQQVPRGADTDAQMYEARVIAANKDDRQQPRQQGVGLANMVVSMRPPRFTVPTPSPSPSGMHIPQIDGPQSMMHSGQIERCKDKCYPASIDLKPVAAYLSSPGISPNWSGPNVILGRAVLCEVDGKLVVYLDNDATLPASYDKSRTVKAKISPTDAKRMGINDRNSHEESVAQAVELPPDACPVDPLPPPKATEAVPEPCQEPILTPVPKIPAVPAHRLEIPAEPRKEVPAEPRNIRFAPFE